MPIIKIVRGSSNIRRTDTILKTVLEEYAGKMMYICGYMGIQQITERYGTEIITKATFRPNAPSSFEGNRVVVFDSVKDISIIKQALLEGVKTLIVTLDCPNDIITMSSKTITNKKLQDLSYTKDKSIAIVSGNQDLPYYLYRNSEKIHLVKEVSDIPNRVEKIYLVDYIVKDLIDAVHTESDVVLLEV